MGSKAVIETSVRALVGFCVGGFFFWALFAFVSAEPNVWVWMPEGRMALAILALFCGCVSVLFEAVH